MVLPIMKKESFDEVGTIEGYLKLLLAFRALPEFSSRQTFLEVSGYPHYENVCSNILQFYLNPMGEHGLKDLLLSSFLKMTGMQGVLIPDKVEITREYPAEGQQRIDLVVDSDIFTLGIENKIYHHEGNDFESYARVINKLGYGKEVIKVILCLRRKGDWESIAGGFKRFTYVDLWQQVGRMLPSYMAHADSKWLTFLLDFMQTTDNLAGENMELKKTDRFFIEHSGEVEKLVTQWDAFQTRLSSKVVMLLELMEEVVESKRLSKLWICKKLCLVLDFNFGGNLIAFDLQLGTNGWELQLFARNAKSQKYFDKLVKGAVLKPKFESVKVRDGRWILESWPLDEDLQVIREVLCSWIRLLFDADKAEKLRLC